MALRPKVFNQAIFDEMMALVAEGRTTSSIVQSSRRFPAWGVVRNWFDAMPELKFKYSEARTTWARAKRASGDHSVAPYGGPSEYDEDLFVEILTAISTGRTLIEILDEKPRMPSISKFNTWIMDDPGANERYLAARTLQADAFVDQIIVMADDPANTDPDTANWRRMQIDARKWTASRLRPSRWGDRVMNEVTGAEGGALVTEVVYMVHDPKQPPMLTIVKNKEPDEAA
jgi:hypothetical protein